MIQSSLQIFKRWPQTYKIWFVLVLGTFWLLRANFSYQHGNRDYMHVDGSTENFSIYAAKEFAKNGFFKNYLLPTYPPFGFDPNGKTRTEPFVYNHYLAGPDYVLGVVVKVFGENAIWAGRLVPLSLTAFALFLLGTQFAVFLSSAFMGCLIVSLLMIPRGLTVWAINIYGHSYVLAFYLFLVAGLLWLTNQTRVLANGSTAKSQKPIQAYKTSAWILGFSVGFGQMLFAMDWVPLTFLAALSFVLLNPSLNNRIAKRVLVGIFLGSTAAFLYQILLSTLYFKSFSFVVSNFLEWGKWRAQGIAADGLDPGEMRIHRIWHEFNKQTYGTTGWTAVNLLILSAAFLAMGFASKVRSAYESKRGGVALLCAWIAVVIWCFAFRQHALVHVRFINRHFFVLYMTMLLITLPISHTLVARAKKAKSA